MSMTTVARQTINTPRHAIAADPAITQGDTHAAATALSQSPASTVQAPTVTPLQKLLADNETIKDVALRLRGIVGWVDSNFSTWLTKTRVNAHPDSTYALSGVTFPNIATVIADLGYKLPSTDDEVKALAHALEQKADQHPLGNFGGGLSWPVPLSHADLAKMQAFVVSDESGTKGQKGYLLDSRSIPASDLQNPAEALQRILENPRTLALGQELQRHMDGVSTDTSTYDYVLALLHYKLDPESWAAPERNKIANFDLLQPDNWGQPPSQVAAKLRNHLIAQKRCSPALANMVSYLLLARTAPQFLIKDMPDSVTIGSQAWVNLSIAAATVEAERPGAVANMTFAQVMSYSTTTEGQSDAVASAQRNALVDWAVANGVVQKSTDDAYTGEQLDTIRTAFNQQLNDRLSASQTMDKAIPTRKEIALEKLKERFGDLGALFEEKLLGTDQYSGEPEQVGLSGLHSLLDIAMMDLPNSRPFTSSDSRIPLAALNSNRTFGVTQAFDQQVASAIEDKKAAVNTTVRHLISQLPLEDRKNFEHGKISFFQESSYQLGAGFWGSTPGPKQPQLLANIERDGKTYAYEINFNTGTIKPVNAQRAKQQEARQAAWVDQTVKFEPLGSSPNLERESPSSESSINSFSSSRSADVADVFIAHLELDDPDIKKQARGQTTLDELNGGPKPLSDFLLNLIPLRSAIVNFQKGNYGEGVFDLSLDVFGFLTAGAATAGKLVKIGSSSLSTGAKALKTAKVIGAATIGVLNPVSGLGDVAAAGGKLLSKGAGYLASKGSEIVNKLKGATGSYDLLKAASKSNGVTATGTYTLAEQTLETGAVFREGQWYGFDPIGNRPYGPPLKDFTPKVVALEGEIRTFTDTWLGKMIGSVLAPPAVNPNFRSDFIEAVKTAKATDKAAYIRGSNSGKPEQIFGYSTALKPDDLKRLAVAERRTPQELGALVRRIDELDALPARLNTTRQTSRIVDPEGFRRGYAKGKPDEIAGFSETLTNYQLAELAVVRGRTPEEVGRLIKYLENRRIWISLENYQAFRADLGHVGVKIESSPQGFYLSQVALLSEGECAALSNVMAAATKHGKQQTFLSNMHTSLTPTLSPTEIAELRKIDPAKAVIEERRATRVAKFHDQLDSYQEILGKRFHHGMQERQVPYTTIISELASARISKTLLINGPGHGITAGVVINGGKKEWFYFDPNFGKATFSTEAAMSASLEKALKSGRTKSLLNHYGDNPAAPEYKISVFDEVELNNSVKAAPGAVTDLFMTEL
ncbi:hypothetical protein [Pseudomonas sp. AMR01]|uniref:hypothetical protein n=1 Tax=Pseudomonas sp. AMR01 TaxID=3064904 RepID=UPI0035C03BEE